MSDNPGKASQELIDTINRWYMSASDFVRDVYPAEVKAGKFDDWQWEALDAISVDDHVAIRSGHGVGKTAFIAICVIWFLATRGECKIPCTAPSAHQLEDILWPEIDKWIKKLPKKFQELYNPKSKHIEMTENPKQAFAVARTARKEKPEALQGFHSENILFVMDEGSGIEEIIFETAEGALSTEGAKSIIAGNPTRTSGFFFDCFHKMKDEWRTFHIPCSASKHASEKYDKKMAKRYGKDSNIYRVRVLGDFPKDDDDCIIRLSTVEAAVVRDVETTDSPVIWGLDVARFGSDKTALAKRQGNTLLEKVKTWHGKDTMQVAGIVKLEFDQTPSVLKPSSINVDTIGLGAGVYDRLKQLGLPVASVNVSEAASVKEQYLRLRDELWFDGREWFEALDCKIPDDEELIGELTSAKYTITPAGKFAAESKKDMKERGLDSPDRADAFLNTFAPVGATSYEFKKELPVADCERAVV